MREAGKQIMKLPKNSRMADERAAIEQLSRNPPYRTRAVNAAAIPLRSGVTTIMWSGIGVAVLLLIGWLLRIR
jgi:hypothetical protein